MVRLRKNNISSKTDRTSYFQNISVPRTAQAAFLNPTQGEQKRRFFHAPCYAVEQEKALQQAAFGARFWQGKVFIPFPLKTRFYYVTKPQQRSDEQWPFSVWNETAAIQ